MSEQQIGGSLPLTRELLDRWATDPKGAVALHVKQTLLPVGVTGSEGSEETESTGIIGKGIVFPPTYADIGYNIDTLWDGARDVRVVTIDSVGSQANRMEPLFRAGGPLADLVPQIAIEINNGAKVLVFDLPHRAADATVQSSPKLAKLASDAFEALKQGNAAPLCAFAPTSLVFGVWDSRGGTGEKRPRLVRSLIRAWDVQELHAAAQFNSVWKKLDGEQQTELKKEAKQKKVDLSVKGLADAPATFRKTKIPQYRDGAPNPDARVLGGVLVRDRIERELTVNLLALRGLRAANDQETGCLRRYLLGLTLLAAISETDLFLREGCLLRYAHNDEEVWYALPRRGDPQRIDFTTAFATIKAYAEEALRPFKDKWPKELEYKFDIAEAKKLLAKKSEEGGPE